MNYKEDTIRDHSCERFRLFHSMRFEQYCTPTISVEGQVCGCDAQHPMLISFCPFCGEQLPPFPESSKYRKITDDGIISYDYDD